MKKIKTKNQNENDAWMQGLNWPKKIAKLKKSEVCWSIEGQNAQIQKTSTKMKREKIVLGERQL